MDTTTDFQHQPFRLDADAIADPSSVVQRFFELYPLPACRNLLWEIQSAALDTKGAGNALETFSEWVHFHHEMEQLMEAAFLLRHAKLSLNPA